MDNNYYLIECPHCHQEIQIMKNEINCQIFRHGVFKENYQQIPPHLDQNQCQLLVNSNRIYGCASPFRFDGNQVSVCGYI